jgi:hypothetical protein
MAIAECTAPHEAGRIAADAQTFAALNFQILEWMLEGSSLGGPLNVSQ